MAYLKMAFAFLVQVLGNALRRLLLPALTMLLLGCGPSAKTTRQQAIDTSALETTLRRGVSSVADVRAALGEPNGMGSLLLPSERLPSTVLFYERIAAGPPEGRDARGYVKLGIQQDLLMVFIRDERYAGFLWFSDAQKPQ